MSGLVTFPELFTLSETVEAQMNKELRDYIASYPTSFGSPDANRVLVLCHDDVDHLDRRVLQQTRLLRERGFTVQIVCIGEKKQEVVEHILPNGEHVYAIPACTLKPFPDTLWGKPQSKFDAKRLGKFFGLFSKKSAAPITDKTRPCTFNSWYPMPFTSGFLEVGVRYPSTIVMAHDLPALAAAGYLAELWNAKFIYDSHEIYPEQVSLDMDQRYVLNCWEAWALKRVHLSYTNSENNAEYIALRYGMKQPMKVITNAPVFPTNPKGAHPLRKMIGATKDEFVVLYHGGLSPHRNIEELIHGFAKAKIPNSHLALLGYGDMEYFANLLNVIAMPNIHLLDAVPQIELGVFVSDADLVAIPYPAIDENTRYCSPNKLFDCIALGVPALVNQALVTAGKIVDDYNLGSTIMADSLEDIAVALKHNADNLASLRNPAPFKVARNALGWSAQAKKLNMWLDETLGVQAVDVPASIAS